ncbi:hypothetical protein H4R33_001922 [Dimargaris cristalligena]|uniref:S-adenosyl-L-methionine-dependent methyltransferase n=1 Tax=Dimargaris cristalligena TaxID=215637 RepID=A0A4P9ZLD1_9FUNG|nr:hypothetical protein H4R33_001922 [Dimargaris cristalligena]RKP34116.1 S-adenosyl-L-methionine-dependent methyltransferase [Dimargaris cristalligena]|eukprot:RKP34116.1 S-adenosyl-L-methionine-dependent methyltransferase [Dimargaris cristalligena]
MPRGHARTLAQALRGLHDRLAKLPTEGGLSNARQELRWLQDHAAQIPTRTSGHNSACPANSPRSYLHRIRRRNTETSCHPAKMNHSHQPLSMPDILDLRPHQYRWLRRAVFERVHHRKPLQYILGTQPFGDLIDVLVRSPTLIPRWETEEWVMQLIRWLNQLSKTSDEQSSNSASSPLRILDLCTGSGCIALQLAAGLKTRSAQIIGVDIAPTAYQLALDNLAHNRTCLCNSVSFLLADVLSSDLHLLLKPHWPINDSAGSGLDIPADMVVVNPPYVSAMEHTTLLPEVGLWEDRRALVPQTLHPNPGAPHGDNDGLSFYAQLIPQLVRQGIVRPAGQTATNTKLLKLTPDSNLPAIPKLVMETGGNHQTRPIVEYLLQAGFSQVGVWQDLAGHDRVIFGW